MQEKSADAIVSHFCINVYELLYRGGILRRMQPRGSFQDRWQVYYRAKAKSLLR